MDLNRVIVGDNPTETGAVSYMFNDIIDDKHMKYMDIFSKNKEPSIFWAIGIENESYFMLDRLLPSSAFCALKPKRERYSVNYYKNFKQVPLDATLNTLRSSTGLTYPVYLNSHSFQAVDKKLQHRTFYDTQSTPNPAFTESVHDALLRECPFYQSVFEKSVVFDGDSIEFITQQFHNTTVTECMNEFVQLKQQFLQEIRPFFQKWGIGTLCYPDHNYGLVTFLSTQRSNLLVCNNGTIHVNLTLPTLLEDGLIVDKDRFAREHFTCMEYIQIVEPLLVACYGTPDVFSVVDPAYSIGSLRVSMSRYISLQTYDTTSPVNGKLLVMDKPVDSDFWYNQLKDTPYIPNESIGYDLNFNKFKNHGIEIRFFEWFPEEYLTDVMNFIVLLAAHSLERKSFSFDKSRYNTLIRHCVQKGFTYRMDSKESNVILHDLGLPLINDPCVAHTLLQSISDQLYDRYHEHELICRMSPNMKRPTIVNYNRIAFEALHRDVMGKPELVIRSELNPLEARTPLVPADLSSLLSIYDVKVESSTTRCYSDQDYVEKGATIVPAGYWVQTKNSYVIGLKAIDQPTQPTQTLLHFAHCFKGQEGSKEVINLLRPSTFIDYEYMLDQEKKRVISFCAQSGKVGAYLALMAFYGDLPPFDEEVYRSILQKMVVKPKVLLIGYGTAGKRSKEIIEQFGIECTIWNSQSVIDRQAILDHDILIHAIRLPDDHSITIPPFLTLDNLSTDHRLSVICDISCDFGNPRNTLPIYQGFTTKTNPIVRIPGNIDLIAINNLPSMEPDVSSNQFSSILSNYLPELRYMNHTYPVNDKAACLYQSYQTFCKFK